MDHRENGADSAGVIASRDNELNEPFGGFHELLMHGSHGRVILRHNRVEATAAGLHVALGSAQNPHIHISFDEHPQAKRSRSTLSTRIRIPSISNTRRDSTCTVSVERRCSRSCIWVDQVRYQ